MSNDVRIMCNRCIALSLLALASAAPLRAQEQQGAGGAQLPTLSLEASTAIEELSARYATEIPQVQGWFRDRAALYYDFGRVEQPVAVGRVLWPIHGFDAAGNPVAIRGQRPIFSAIPGTEGYSGLWKLEYVVTADFAQPNTLTTVAAVDSLVRRRRAYIRDAALVINLPIVARGSRLAQDTLTAGALGWYEGREVQYFDFGPATSAPAPMWRFARGTDDMGAPRLLEGQNSILDSIPVAPSYPDLWDIRIVRVDSTYRENTIRSATALRAAGLPVDSATVIANLPVTVLDGAPVRRVVSPITQFADMRSPFPPAPTTIRVP